MRNTHFYILYLFFLLLTGCIHKIHVTPAAFGKSGETIPQSVRLNIPFLAIEGPDHRPGIAMLEWPIQDLQTAITAYLRQRGTFSYVSEEEGTLTLTIRAWLWMRSRAEYRYTIRLESDLGPSGKPPTKSYLVQKEEIGSRIRWDTASDEAPITKALQAALDDLLMQIEEDAILHGKKPPRSS